MIQSIPAIRAPARRAAWHWRPLIALTLCLLAWGGAATAAVSARFDRPEVHEGETVALIIEAEGLGGATPDLSALETDFEVLGSATSNRIQIVNGRQSATRGWQVTLSPKRLGTIEVPPIQVGDEQTPVLRLRVTGMPQGATGASGDELFLEVELGGDGEPVLVQQQVPMTVRLFTSLPLRVGELTEPRPDGAVVERLGEDVQYDSVRNGRVYRVIERRFSLSPERSGELRIPPVAFTGELRSADSGPFGNDRLTELFRDPVFERFGGGLFERGKPVRARSQAATLTVLPRPEDSAGRWWLPAQALDIKDSWDADAPELIAGEPATRTLTINATGLAGSQIPDIEVPAPAGVRVYPEGVEAETRTDGERLFGVSRQRVTVMPTEGGRLRFPEIRLRWWDVRAGRERVAVVPERTLLAAGSTAGGGVAERGGTPAADAGGPATADAEPNRVVEPGRPPGWLLAAVVGLGVLALSWRLRHRLTSWTGRSGGARQARGGAAASVTELRQPTVKTASRRGTAPLAALRAACDADDARAASTALFGLARARWGRSAPASLGGIAARLVHEQAAEGARAAAAVRSLEASLYGPGADAGTAEWRGAELIAAMQRALDAPAPRHGPEPPGEVPLAPLYPRRG
jgi:hypothetical protein